MPLVKRIRRLNRCKTQGNLVSKFTVKLTGHRGHDSNRESATINLYLHRRGKGKHLYGHYLFSRTTIVDVVST